MHRRVTLENSAAGEHANFELAILSAKSCALRIIDNPEGERLASMMKREKYVCAVNGGYFDEEFKPIGLRIVNGQMLTPLKRARLITGVLSRRRTVCKSSMRVSFRSVRKLRPQFSAGRSWLIARSALVA